MINPLRKQPPLSTVTELLEMTQLLGQGKMAVIFRMTFSNAFSWMQMHIISLKFVPKGLINNIPVLVQIVSWRKAGNKPINI